MHKKDEKGHIDAFYSLLRIQLAAFLFAGAWAIMLGNMYYGNDGQFIPEQTIEVAQHTLYVSAR